MPTRVTQRLLADRVIQDLRVHMRDILKLQNQLATGHRINRPSEDPIGTRNAIDSRSLIQKGEQYIDNISMTRPQLQETASMVAHGINAIQRVRELTLQGANGLNDDETRSYLAEEVNEILESMLDNANHISNGRYIFSGSKTLTPAFSASRDPVTNEITSVTYNGDYDDINLSVTDNIKVPINLPGGEVYGDAANPSAGIDIFHLLIQIRNDLRDDSTAVPPGDKNNLRSVRLAELDQAQQQLARMQARIGARQNQVDRLERDHEEINSLNQEYLSQILDTDFAETILDVNVRQNAYQAALNAAGRVIQPSLLDYVR